MGIFNNKFEINIENPFERDKLKREDEANMITSLFDAVGNQMVLAINSPWGTGKTTFLNMWKAKLEKDGYSTVYFNCWKNDFVEDPFIAFIEEFRQQLDSGLISKEFKEKATEVGKHIFKNIPGVVMKGIKNKTGIDIEEIISEDELESIVSNKLDEYSKTKDSVEKFKEELIKLSSNNIEKTEKPLIVFVDELDRCRPDFAISLLERVKHFFNVENIIFILGIDKDSLSNSVKVVYGEGTDINGYLTRFIDMEYTLNQGYNKEYIAFLMDKYNFNKVFEDRRRIEGPSIESSVGEFKHLTVEILDAFKFSLRDIEKIIANLYLIVSINKNKYLYPYALISILALKKYDRELYNKFKSKNITTKELVESIKDFKIWINKANHIGSFVEAYWIYMLEDKDIIEEKKKILEEKMRENPEEYRYPERYCIQCYEGLEQTYFSSNVEYMHKSTIQKIDMYENYLL